MKCSILYVIAGQILGLILYHSKLSGQSIFSTKFSLKRKYHNTSKNEIKLKQIKKQTFSNESNSNFHQFINLFGLCFRAENGDP